MRRTIYVLVSASAALLAAVPSGADNASFSNDLKATIALQGMPCDQIVDAKRNGDSDYTATCKDGNRYHVFVNPKGRVVVQKL
ncbi:MAG TPA: hypothetical protein VKP66_00780 [Steroidobacteraceae bacterium]|nr:hypothetical protein [Steroidobacteraceae bacterium]